MLVQLEARNDIAHHSPSSFLKIDNHLDKFEIKYQEIELFINSDQSEGVLTIYRILFDKDDEIYNNPNLHSEYDEFEIPEG
ncbi:hypothetical protein RclHR1_18980001 [Rhizophagus clarus]|uniref:Uncharacterized protein n=1 Tax=Rhizophagus clarus TaxID=94130 RepID=A0A2Z6QSI3_9GLOM|nr:hypothetical protein RclHR1_18980001 [Rhizophagus clarus]